jgi:hypothetical protein
MMVSQPTSADGSSTPFWDSNKQKTYGEEEFVQAANGIDQATSRVQAESGKSGHAAQRGALKMPAIYRFKNLLGDEDGRTIQGWQISVGGRPYRAEKSCRGGMH